MAKLIFLNRFFYPDQSPAARQLADLAFHEAERGRTVYVITSRDRSDDTALALPEHELINGVRVVRVGSSDFHQRSRLGRAVSAFGFRMSAARRLRRMIQRGDVVVAVDDPPDLIVLAARIAKRNRARMVAWFQGLAAAMATKEGAGGPTDERLAAVAQADVVVAPGRRITDRLQREGIGEGNLRVIPGWLGGRVVEPVAPADNTLRRVWGLEGKFVVGYAGESGVPWDLETLLEAAALVKAQAAGVVFLFIGNGRRGERLAAALSRRNLGNVLYKPLASTERLAELLSAPDLHLVTLPVGRAARAVPAELYAATAVGRPLLCLGDAGDEVPQLLEEAGCGMTVAHGDAAALAQTILNFAADRATCKAMGEQARLLHNQRFDRRAALQRWNQLLDEQLAGNP